MKNSFEWDARTRRRKRNERRLTRRVGCCCCCSRSPSHRENTSMVCTTFNFRLLGNFASHNWVTESLDVLPRTSNIFPLAVWVCFGFCVWLRIENNPYYDQSSISFSAFTFSHIIHDIWIFFAVATYPFECDLTYTHTHKQLHMRSVEIRKDVCFVFLSADKFWKRKACQNTTYFERILQHTVLFCRQVWNAYTLVNLNGSYVQMHKHSTYSRGKKKKRAYEIHTINFNGKVVFFVFALVGNIS